MLLYAASLGKYSAYCIVFTVPLMVYKLRMNVVCLKNVSAVWNIGRWMAMSGSIKKNPDPLNIASSQREII